MFTGALGARGYAPNMRNLAFVAFAVGLFAVLAGNGLSTIPDAPVKDTRKHHRAKVSHSGGDVVLNRGRGGHYFADVEVNGTSLRMVADTGATLIALSMEDAEAAGIDTENLKFSSTVSTANGDVGAAVVMLDEVSVGSITRRNVAAMVTPGLATGSLLGMSFFKTLSKVAMESDEMVLQD